MTPEVDFKDLPHFKPKKQKLLAAILLLIEEAAKMKRTLSKGEIVKSLFVADDTHLQKHGRPITFDNYVALAKGPVGDLTSDMLNDRVEWSDFELAVAPWQRRDVRGLDRYAAGPVASNRRKLSPSDIEELTAALRHVTGAGFQKISDDTHVHPAWSRAWERKGENARAAAMDWREFPALDEDTVSDLVMASWNAS